MSEERLPYNAQPPEPEEDKAVVEEAKESGMDFEKSYNELHSKYGEQSNQIGELRQQVKNMESKSAESDRLASEREAKAKDQPPATDYEKMLRDIAQKYDDGDMTYEQSLLESNRITREQTLQEGALEKESLLEQARNEAQELLSNKETEFVVDKFYDDNPDFEEMQDSGKLQEVMAKNPVLDELAAFYMLKAESAFEQGKEEAARVASGSEKAAKVLADDGASMQQQQSKPVRGEAALKASMLASLE